MTTIGMLRPLARCVAVLALLGVGACITPSIPIPPPDPSDMTFTVSIMPTSLASTAVFSYPPDANYAGSVCYVYNRIRGTGVIQATNSDGSVSQTAPFDAQLGDQIEVTFQREDQTVSSCIVLRNGPQDPNTYCD